MGSETEDKTTEITFPSVTDLATMLDPLINQLHDKRVDLCLYLIRGRFSVGFFNPHKATLCKGYFWNTSASGTSNPETVAARLLLYAGK